MMKLKMLIDLVLDDLLEAWHRMENAKTNLCDLDDNQVLKMTEELNQMQVRISEIRLDLFERFEMGGAISPLSFSQIRGNISPLYKKP